jgi:hypothetical protein
MTQKETTYKLVIIVNDVETTLFVSENLREVELQRQIHIRSLAPGLAEIREVQE